MCRGSVIIDLVSRMNSQRGCWQLAWQLEARFARIIRTVETVAFCSGGPTNGFVEIRACHPLQPLEGLGQSSLSPSLTLSGLVFICVENSCLVVFGAITDGPPWARWAAGSRGNVVRLCAGLPVSSRWIACSVADDGPVQTEENKP